MNGNDIHVKEVFDRVYKEGGFVPTSKATNDPWSRPRLEMEARRRAMVEMSVKDRTEIESCVKRLKECCPGVYLGDSAALQILQHIGIFLNEAGRRER